MQMDALGWFVTAIAILLTGISKAGLGGALGGLAVPFMSMWIPPRDAVAVVLPILIVMDMVGIRAWRGKADWQDNWDSGRTDAIPRALELTLTRRGAAPVTRMFLVGTGE